MSDTCEPQVRTRTVLLTSVGIALATLLLYASVRGHEFTSFDDNQYVTENPQVLAGLTVEGVRWAFSESYAANWHPLTWLSHMLDVELFGLSAGAHHLTSALLHALNGALGFVALFVLTRSFGPSLLAALLFAWHPLRVESVAWVSERKDVLSGLFWMLALTAYGLYARRRSAWSYALLVSAFACGLLAKPMIVTLPCVLLLLDAWPLGRPKTEGWRPLWIEKLPLFALSGLSSALTVWSQGKDEAISSLELLPLGARLANVPLALGGYLQKTVWPRDLACYYPHPALVERDTFSPWNASTLAWAAGLVVLTLVVALQARRRPYLPVGWLWFLGTLLPVIGIVQVGTQSFADRYSYVPSIGLALAFSWFLFESVSNRPVRTALGLACLIPLAWVTSRQIRVWRSSIDLYEHAIAVTEGNTVALTNLGEELRSRGREREAVELFRKALAADRFHFLACANLGRSYLSLGDLDSAETYYRRSLAIRPEDALSQHGLGVVYLRKKELQRAMGSFLKALELDPGLPETHFNLGVVFQERREFDRALESFRRTVQLRPDMASAHTGLAYAAERVGDFPSALRHHRRALELEPRATRSARLLAWILATHPDATYRNGAEAVRLAQKAARATGYSNPVHLAVLAAALAESGDFEQAVERQRQALELSRNPELDRARLEAYKAGRPWRTN